jgi:Tfp pilus assembly protein PilV
MKRHLAAQKSQQGASIVEILVGVSLLSVITLSLFQTLNLEKLSQLRSNASLQALEEQYLLDRAIWARYNNFPNSIPNCDITSAGFISLHPTSTCQSNKLGSVNAEVINLFKCASAIECAAPIASHSNASGESKLTFKWNSSDLTGLLNGINQLSEKHSLRVQVIQNSDPSSYSKNCRIKRAENGASIGELQLIVDDACIPPSIASSPQIILPRKLIKFGKKNGEYDGYYRVYY